jgi:DNA invertase Pin-like site-specific DNA recombinase
MITNFHIPAAQYLRMSTENQQYSLQNQADAIANYATDHGFEVVKTYSDAAKSGLRLKNRGGLKQLLKDVVEGQTAFRAVLVYDVSRWGRFQDTDEAAHYEYLCKSSGVPIHYCAEQFLNDNSVSGLLLKALKRTMAGEYSRELSIKVRAGQFRLASLGYKMGGHTPFGLRRQLLDVSGAHKQLLSYGERKSIVNDRVTLVPGPPEEVAIVERLFREFTDEKKTLKAIASDLNREGILFTTGHSWTECTVSNVLRNPKYLGLQIWGRTTDYLSGKVTRLPKERWAICHRAFQPIITLDLFERAQARIANFTHNLSNEHLLDRLKAVLANHGKLSTKIIDKSRSCPGVSTYYARFGGLLNVYQRLGYSTPELSSGATTRQRKLLLRSALIKRLVEATPGEIEEIRKSRRFRSLLRYRKTGLLIAVVLAQHGEDTSGAYWRIDGPRAEGKRTAIVAFLNQENTVIQSLRVFQQLRFARLTIRNGRNDEWLLSGRLLRDAGQFLEVLEMLTSQTTRV